METAGSTVFDFNADYILEDSRVMLRPLKPEDFNLLLCFSEQEPELWQFNAGGAAGADNLKLYLETAFEQRARGFGYPFIVWDKASQSYAGSTRFYDFQFDRKTVQVGFTWYGKQHQGSGINKACKSLLLDFAFSQLDMERVGFAANAANTRSINAMKSIGCTVEGILRSNSLDAQGARIDNIVLSILRSEWDAGLKEPNSGQSKKPLFPKALDLSNTAHYTWGENCRSYVLTESPGLSVKQELMPPGTKEALHYHARSRQVFHILKGQANFFIDGVELPAASGQSIVIEPGQQHFIANSKAEELTFLVISQPSTLGDRINVTI